MYTPCSSAISANIAQNCTNPLVSGYTGRGLLIPWANVASLTKATANPRHIEAITLETDTNLAVIDNVFAEPFTGSSTASSADSGRPMFTKTVAFRIPLRGGEVSKNIVEPLLNDAEGFLVVLEKKDKVGDGSYEVVGAVQPFKVNADGITRNEFENGGDISVTGTAVEPFFEVTLFDTDYATSKAEFETLMTKAF